MSSGKKNLIGVALFAVLAVSILLWSVLLSGIDQGTVVHVLVVIGIPLCIAHSAACFYALVWVIKNFDGRRRVWWILGFVFGGSLGAIVWWLVVVRNLPEPSDPAHAPA